MGVEEAPGAGGAGGIRALRRKQVDSDRARAAGGQQLAKELSVTQLIAIGASFNNSLLFAFS
jgi:cationic amino acid transporter 1